MSALLIVFMTLIFKESKSQVINWAGMNDEKRHIVNTNIGLEHGAVLGFGYGYKITSGIFPVVINVEYSFPSGENILDDFKTKIGAQVRLIEYNNFIFSAKVHGVFRRYENDFARLLNFGSDISGIAGYYKTNWYVAGEVGFDKAIVTHFKHSVNYRSQYDAVVDGWYEPATGGNFYYGFQGGISFGKNDFYVRAGKIVSQDFETNPMVPFYLQLGYNVKF